MSNKTRNKRIAAGLCVYCGGPLDSDKRMCKACREKESERRKASRAYYIKIGICPKCKKERIYENEKSCPECREKQRRYIDKNRDKYSKSCRKYSLKIYRYRRQNDLCVYCGKPLDREGIYCRKCLPKVNKKNKKTVKLKALSDIPRNEWPDYGFCYRCGNPIAGGRLCEKCKQSSVDNLPEDRCGGDHWRLANRALKKVVSN